MADLFAQLTPEPEIDAIRPERLFYRGTLKGLSVKLAVAPDGSADLEVASRRAPRLRFVRRAQLADRRLATSDPAFDAAVGILGDLEGLLALGAASRGRLRAWLDQPLAWCSDARAGRRGVPAAEIEGCVAAAIALLDGFQAPDLATLVRERAGHGPALQARIDARVLAEIADAARLDALLDAMRGVEPAVALPWLEAALDRLLPYADQVLALLPDPAPQAFDGLIHAWTRFDPRLEGRLTAILASPPRALALLTAASDQAEAFADLAERLPRDAVTAGWIEGLSPRTPAARRARLDALAARPAGDPLAYRADLRSPDDALRARAGEVVTRHLSTWLAHPEQAAAVLRKLGLGDAHGAQFIALATRHRDPHLIDALAGHRFDDPALERQRLDALRGLPLVRPFPIAALLATRDPGARAAAIALLRAHLDLWLADHEASRELAGAIPFDPETEALILETARTRPCPGASPILIALPTRNEGERLAVIEALGRTGSPWAESALLSRMEQGYRARLACVEALGAVGQKAGLRALEQIAGGFLVERTLKEAALRSIRAIEARLGGGSGALSLSRSDGRLSLPEDD